MSHSARLSKGTVYRAIQNGELPSIRVGRRLLIPTKQLRLLLNPLQKESGVAFQGDAALDPTADVSPVPPNST